MLWKRKSSRKEGRGTIQLTGERVLIVYEEKE